MDKSLCTKNYKLKYELSLFELYLTWDLVNFLYTILKTAKCSQKIKNPTLIEKGKKLEETEQVLFCKGDFEHVADFVSCAALQRRHFGTTTS